ncbi:MAG: LysR family transcriptional regulator [Pseudomonadota bacterium]
MSDSYRGLAVFVAVADLGSFSAAGRRLKISTSVVSHHVSKLEDKLGVPLFFRSTRALSLTSEGQHILDAARRMVSAGDEALDALADHTEQPVGALRVALPAFGTEGGIHLAIWKFAQSHPLVALSVHCSDQPVDLVKEGYDLAIRLGRLADSALKTRRIGTFRRKLVAAPSYLKGRVPLRELKDFNRHEFISFSVTGDAMYLLRQGEQAAVTLENVRLEVDSVSAGKSAALAGLGLMSLPLNEIEKELRSGELVEVLPEWSFAEMGVYAIWPDSGPQKKLTHRMIDFFVEHHELLDL